MQIDIQTLHFSLTDAIRNHAEKRLSFSLTCSNLNIQKIVMRLSNINTPRGEADKRCQVHVVLAGLPDVVIEDTKTNLYAAINRAVERTTRTIFRKVKRKKRHVKNIDLDVLDIESSQAV